METPSNTSKLNIIVLAVVSILVIGGLVWAVTSSKKEVRNVTESANTLPETEEQNTQMVKEPGMDLGTMTEANTNKTDAADVMLTGSYKDYSPAAVTSEFKAGNKVVLFFHATWCPTCKQADAAFKTNAGQIPAGVTVLKTDYDSNTELKQKYGITYQHTFVQIDSAGNEITKWNGGDIDNLKKYIK